MKHRSSDPKKGTTLLGDPSPPVKAATLIGVYWEFLLRFRLLVQFRGQPYGGDRAKNVLCHDFEQFEEDRLHRSPERKKALANLRPELGGTRCASVVFEVLRRRDRKYVV